MINIEQTTDYKKYVEKAFDDISFTNMYKSIFHVDNKDQCIANELYIFKNMENMKFYTLNYNNEFAAYFAQEEINDIKYLTTFFIEKKYRNKEFYKLFLQELYNNISDVFFSYRNNKNTKAINFYNLLGATLLSISKDYHLFLFKRSI